MGKRGDGIDTSTFYRSAYIVDKSKVKVSEQPSCEAGFVAGFGTRPPLFFGRITRDSSIANSWNGCRATQTFSQSVSHQSQLAGLHECVR
jgi:hypothetical protein